MQIGGSKILIEQQIGVSRIRPVALIGEAFQNVGLLSKLLHIRHNGIVIVIYDIFLALRNVGQISAKLLTAQIHFVGGVGKLPCDGVLSLTGNAQLLLGEDSLAQIPCIADSSRQDLMQSHIQAGFCFNIDDLPISIQINLVSGAEFVLCVDAVAGD